MDQPGRGAVFDLSARTKLRLTGPDRLRYLNGQMTNDARKASASAAIQSCVLNVKGKISAEIFLRTDGDSFLLDSEAEREQLIARLERYIIADDVQIADVTDEFALFHLLGASEVAAGAVTSTRFGLSGADVWVWQSEHELVAARLRAALPFCDADCEETFRIERGLPRWGRELTEEIIPTEANLEGSAIDFAKGCYIGQEIISRIKMSGQTNKRLCGLISNAEVSLQAGMRLWTTEGEAKDVGWITSATRSARVGAQIALGFLKRGFQEHGLLLTARDGAGAEVPVQVTALPFI